ncbi:FAD/NAD(P)-binding protein, partial [Streptomyces sp. NPDC004752]
MTEVRKRPAVAIVGAGASGTLTAVQLCETAARRRIPLDLVLIDPAPEAGRGVAYATRDPRHRLNVPAGGMSAYPDDPGHFTRWLCRHGEPAVTGADFATRYRYGAYLADALGRAVVRAHGTVAVRRLRTRAEDCTGTPDGRVEIRLADGGPLIADAAVLATGPAAPAAAWVPPRLREAPRFIGTPWAPGALNGPCADTADVLLVGTGLTAVDLALTLDHPGRTVHALSRTGLLPQPHALGPAGSMPAPADLPDASLGRLRRAVYRHLSRSVRIHGDWRPALDSLRPHTTRLWRSLTPEEREEFLAREGALWNTHRHRMAPATAEHVSRARTARRLHVHTGTVVGAHGDAGLRVELSGGRTLHVGWVIDCTGPGRRPDDPLWRALFAAGTAVAGPLGMGVATRDGRLVDARGRTGAPLFTLGAPRRGELWETTAIPEIRGQAAELAG